MLGSPQSGAIKPTIIAVTFFSHPSLRAFAARVPLVASIALTSCNSPLQKPGLERLYALNPDEGVFAYARISPDGRHLAYATEARDSTKRAGLSQVITVVDLANQHIEFAEPGIDAYWSPDGKQMIYLSFVGGPVVTIRNQSTGVLVRDVAPPWFGDYFSWGRRDGKDIIVTILSNYFVLGDGKPVRHAEHVPACTGIGTGERPLVSKDGKRITTFVRGTLVVRDLTDCDETLETGIQGAKADFSWDGRYIAFHAPKSAGTGYEIRVVDLEKRTVRTITGLPGSSFFPSWTSDGRLCFRYDGDEYRGFMMATNVLSAPARALPMAPQHVPAARAWSDIFPETALPGNRIVLVMIWGTWSAHSPFALAELQRASDHFLLEHLDVRVLTATDPGSRPADVERMVAQHHVRISRIPLAESRFSLTEAQNQIPATLLFRDGILAERRLGAQSLESLIELESATRGQSHVTPLPR